MNKRVIILRPVRLVCPVCLTRARRAVAAARPAVAGGGRGGGRAVGVQQADKSETTNFERGCTFQLVDNQVLSTRGQPDVFNLHRLTGAADAPPPVVVR